MHAFLEWRILAGWLVLLACIAVAPLHGQSSEEQLRYLIPADTFEQPSDTEQTAITAAICDGKAEKDRCDTCPGSSAPDAGGVGFSLGRVIMGHFLAPNSVDASPPSPAASKCMRASAGAFCSRGEGGSGKNGRRRWASSSTIAMGCGFGAGGNCWSAKTIGWRSSTGRTAEPRLLQRDSPSAFGIS